MNKSIYYSSIIGMVFLMTASATHALGYLYFNDGVFTIDKGIEEIVIDKIYSFRVGEPLKIHAKEDVIFRVSDQDVITLQEVTNSLDVKPHRDRLQFKVDNNIPLEISSTGVRVQGSILASGNNKPSIEMTGTNRNVEITNSLTANKITSDSYTAITLDNQKKGIFHQNSNLGFYHDGSKFIWHWTRSENSDINTNFIATLEKSGSSGVFKLYGSGSSEDVCVRISPTQEECLSEKSVGTITSHSHEWAKDSSREVTFSDYVGNVPGLYVQRICADSSGVQCPRLECDDGQYLVGINLVDKDGIANSEIICRELPNRTENPI